MAKIRRGLCLYTVEKDGCLNGVYTNEGVKGVICNEIARVHPKGKIDANGIADRYNGYYFDTRGVQSELVVCSKNREYEVDWIVDSKIVYKGFGYLMNSTQLVVHYVSV